MSGVKEGDLRPKTARLVITGDEKKESSPSYPAKPSLPSSTAQIIELIAKGFTMDGVMECKDRFFEQGPDGVRVCALGAAIVGKYGSTSGAFEAIRVERENHIHRKGYTIDYLSLASHLLPVDAEIAEAIDSMHLKGATVAEIIYWLDGKVPPVQKA